MLISAVVYDTIADHQLNAISQVYHLLPRRTPSRTLAEIPYATSWTPSFII